MFSIDFYIDFYIELKGCAMLNCLMNRHAPSTEGGFYESK